MDLLGVVGRQADMAALSASYAITSAGEPIEAVNPLIAFGNGSDWGSVAQQLSHAHRISRLLGGLLFLGNLLLRL